MYTPELYAQQPSASSSYGRDNAAAGPSGSPHAAMHGGQYPSHSIPFTNQMAYQHNFTPNGFSYESPFVYSLTNGANAINAADPTPGGQVPRSDEQIDLYPPSLAEAGTDYSSQVPSTERTLPSLLGDRMFWEPRRKSSDQPDMCSVTRPGTGERFMQLLETKLGVDRQSAYTDDRYTTSEPPAVPSMLHPPDLAGPPAPPTASPYTHDGYPRFPSPSPQLATAYPPDLRSTPDSRSYGLRAPGDLGLRGYGSLAPASQYPPLVPEQYFGWSQAQLGGLASSGDNPYPSMAAGHTAQATIVPGVLGPPVPASMPSTPSFSPALPPRSTASPALFGSIHDESRTNAAPHHADWHGLRNGMQDGLAALAVPLGSMIHGSQGSGSRDHSPSLQSQTQSPPPHAVGPRVSALAHGGVYTHSRQSSNDYDDHHRSISSQSLPAVSTLAPSGGMRQGMYMPNPNRQFSHGPPTWAHSAPIIGHSGSDATADRRNRDMFPVAPMPFAPSASSAASSPADHSNYSSPQLQPHLPSTKSLPLPLHRDASSIRKVKRSVSDGQRLVPTPSRKRKSPTQNVASVSPAGKGKAESVDDDGEKKIIIACHHCRAKKLKCDGGKPKCRNCERRGEETCEYDATLRRRGPGKHNKKYKEKARSRGKDKLGDSEMGRGGHAGRDFDSSGEQINQGGAFEDKAGRIGSRFIISTVRD